MLVGDYHLEFNRDSTATLVMNGQEKSYTWKATSDGAELTPAEGNDTIYFTYEDDQLKASIKDFTLDSRYSYDYVFTREQPEPFVVPAVITAEKEDNFFGDWKAAFTVTPMGVAKVPEEYASLGIKVEFAQITLTMGEDVLYALTNFVDGKLTFDAADLQLGDGTVIVELAKNGYAKLTIDGVPEEQYNYYLMKTDFVADETAPIATTSEETKAE